MDTYTLTYGAMLLIGLGYTVAGKIWRKAFFWIFLGLSLLAYFAGWAYLAETPFWAGGFSLLLLLFFLGVGSSALILKKTDTPAKHVLSPLETLAVLFLTPPLVILFTAAYLYIMARAGHI